MALVRVARLIDASKELNPTALLHDMRRLVRSGVEIRRLVERNRVAHSERSRAERMRSLAGGWAVVRRDSRNVMTTEAALDLVEVRELAATARQRAAGDLVRRAGTNERLLDPRALPDFRTRRFASFIDRSCRLRAPLYDRIADRARDALFSDSSFSLSRTRSVSGHPIALLPVPHARPSAPSSQRITWATLSPRVSHKVRDRRYFGKP
jgi:hypothetical protein